MEDHHISNATSTVSVALRIGALTLALFICLCLVFAASGLQSPERLGKVWVNLLVAALLIAAVVSLLILWSGWAGRPLVAVIFLVLFPVALIPQFLTAGVITAAAFSPVAVLVLGKMHREKAAPVPLTRLAMPKGEWAWKLAIVVAVYLFLHSAFNYFILWCSPAVRAYQGDVEPGVVLANMITVLQRGPRLAPLQAAELVRWAASSVPHVMRALVWTALALPIIRMMKGSWWEAGLAVGLLYAIPGNAQFLLPNPYILDAARPAFLAERACAGFVFGWALVWLLNRHHASPRELFQWREPTVTGYRASFAHLASRVWRRIRTTTSENCQCFAAACVYAIVSLFMPPFCCIIMIFVPIASFPSTEALATRYFHAVINDNLEAATVLAGPDVPWQASMRESARRDIARFAGAEVRHVVIETAVSSGSDESLEFAVVEFEYREPGRFEWQPGRIHLETDHNSLCPRFILANLGYLGDDS